MKRSLAFAIALAAAGMALAEVAWQFTTNRSPEVVSAATNALSVAYSSLGHAPLVTTGGTFDYGAFVTRFRDSLDTATLAAVSSDKVGFTILVK